ncbi:hypothetical protein BRC83_09365 [Halobacteriales archaeon QS_1_68_17]|nr:MAG: hypothetical protein BRC83_09365 [Halobacteriales archaeon QS_1_68_17]
MLYLDYRSDDPEEGLFSAPAPGRAVVLGLTGLVVLGVVLAAGAGFYEQASFERPVNAAASNVLQEERYRGLGITAITVEYRGSAALFEPTTVTVAVSKRPTGSSRTCRTCSPAGSRTGPTSA